MSKLLPTYKELERSLSQSIRALYGNSIDYPPQKVTCKLFSRYLAIVSDDALTPLEKTLWTAGKQELTSEIRSEIDRIIEPKLVSLVENIVEVKIEEVLCNAAFEANKSGILLILSEPPSVRNPQFLPKHRGK